MAIPIRIVSLIACSDLPTSRIDRIRLVDVLHRTAMSICLIVTLGCFVSFLSRICVHVAIPPGGGGSGETSNTRTVCV